MLDVSDFIVEKGGDPNKIRESQRRRYAPEEVVDQVITLFEDHRRSILQTTLYGFSVTILTRHSKIRSFSGQHPNKRQSEGNRIQEKGRLRSVVSHIGGA